MKKIAPLLIIIFLVGLISSCTSYRGAAGGGCQVNRNMVGYR